MSHQSPREKASIHHQSPRKPHQSPQEKTQAVDSQSEDARIALPGSGRSCPHFFFQGREGTLGLGSDGQGDTRRDEVEDDDRRVVVDGDCVGVTERKFRMGPAADRHEDPAGDHMPGQPRLCRQRQPAGQHGTPALGQRDYRPEQRMPGGAG